MEDVGRKRAISFARRLCKEIECVDCPLTSSFETCRPFEEMSNEEIVAATHKLIERWDKGRTKADAVHPNHYKLPNGMQVVDVEVAMLGKAAVQEHCLCTAVEYILRHKGKNGAEDIRKAHWWLSKWVELEDTNEEATAT